jgi:hypothetical protein
MELDPGKPARSASFAFVVLGLVAICAGLGAMLYVTTSAAGGLSQFGLGSAGPEAAPSASSSPASGVGDVVIVRKLLLRLAWGSLTLLCVSLVLLVWAILRHIRQALAPTAPLPPSEYVNAWELAGKRFQLPQDEDQDEDRWRADDEEEGEGGAEDAGDERK